MVQRALTDEELDWIVNQCTATPPFVAATYCAAEWFSDYLPKAKEVDRTLPALFVVAERSADETIPYLKQHLPVIGTFTQCFGMVAFVMTEFEPSMT